MAHAQAVTLPAEVTNILGLIETVSHWMFGLFLAGTCLAFAMIFLNPLSVFSRWVAFVVMIFNFLAALFITVAAVIATIVFVIFKKAATSVTELNIGATIGTEMFAFMWIAAGCAIIAWLIQLGECCCCASRRDVRTGRKRGNKHAYDNDTPGISNGVSEKPKRKSMFGRNK